MARSNKLSTFQSKSFLTRETVTLYLSGFNLFLLQYALMRELTALLFSSEVVVGLVMLAYFSGFSLGYLVSNKLSRKMVSFFLWLNFFFFLTFPFSLKFFSSFLYAHDAKKLAFFSIVASCFLFGPPLYSLFLPRFVRQKEHSLSFLYIVEISGAVSSILVMTLLAPFLTKAWVYLLHNSVLLLLLFVMQKPKVSLRLGLVLCLVLYAFAFHSIDRASTVYKYKKVNGMSDPIVLFSDYSPYNTIEFVQKGRDSKRVYLYLNGLLSFGTRRMNRFNRYLSELPNWLKPDSDILIIGSGSMSSVGYASRYARSISTCELDSKVVAGSKIYLRRYHRLRRKIPWKITYDDGKHFLSKHKQSYDIVILDVPIPVYVQTAFLYTKEFYVEARKALTTNGVLSVSLGGRFKPGHHLPLGIAKAMLHAFPVVYVVRTPIGIDMALGFNSRRVNPEIERLERRLRESLDEVFPKDWFTVYGPEQVKAIAWGAKAISLENLWIVYDIGIARIKRRYFK